MVALSRGVVLLGGARDVCVDLADLRRSPPGCRPRQPCAPSSSAASLATDVEADVPAVAVSLDRRGHLLDRCRHTIRRAAHLRACSRQFLGRRAERHRHSLDVVSAERTCCSTMADRCWRTTSLVALELTLDLVRQVALGQCLRPPGRSSPRIVARHVLPGSALNGDDAADQGRRGPLPVRPTAPSGCSITLTVSEAAARSGQERRHTHFDRLGEQASHCVEVALAFARGLPGDHVVVGAVTGRDSAAQDDARFGHLALPLRGRLGDRRPALHLGRIVAREFRQVRADLLARSSALPKSYGSRSTSCPVTRAKPLGSRSPFEARATSEWTSWASLDDGVRVGDPASVLVQRSHVGVREVPTTSRR